MDSYYNLQRQINQLKQENRNLKDENKRYKILRANNNIIRLGTSRTSKFEHKQRIKQILMVPSSEQPSLRALIKEKLLYQYRRLSMKQDVINDSSIIYESGNLFPDRYGQY